MSEEGLPITREDSDSAATEFLRHWSPKTLVDKGLHQTVKDLFYALQDHGDIVILSVNEVYALSEHLCNEGIGLRVFEEGNDATPELASAVKKVMFCHGRNWGMTNYDMGIEEPDER